MFFELSNVIYLCTKNQQNADFLHYGFHLIIISSTCFELQSVHPQEDLYTEFHGISYMHLHKQYGRWQDRTAYTDAWKKYHKSTCTSHPEDENLDVRNMSKTLQLNENLNVKSVHFVGCYYLYRSVMRLSAQRSPILFPVFLYHFNL